MSGEEIVVNVHSGNLRLTSISVLAITTSASNCIDMKNREVKLSEKMSGVAHFKWTEKQVYNFHQDNTFTGDFVLHVQSLTLGVTLKIEQDKKNNLSPL